MLATVGAHLVAAVAMFAAAAAGDAAPDYLPAIGGAGQLGAVAGLVYVVRALLRGDLVTRSSAVVEAKLLELVEDGHQREETFYQVVGRLGFGTEMQQRRAPKRRES